MSPGSSRFGWRLLAICVAALGVRITIIVLEKADEHPLADAFYYNAQAALNARGDWFVHPFEGGPAADHPPLTATILTPVAWAFDGSLLAQRLAMTAMGIGVVVLVALLAREISRSDRTALVAAGLAAVYPNLWMNDVVVMSETVAALLTAGVLLLTVRWAAAPSRGRLVALGLTCGLAVLARAELALLLPLLVLPVVVLHQPATAGVRTRRLAAVGVLAALVVAPWIAWNMVRFEQPTLISTNDGLTLLGANCEATYTGPLVGTWDPSCVYSYEQTLPADLDQSERSHAYRTEARRFATENVGRLPVVAAARLGRTWSVYRPGQDIEITTGSNVACDDPMVSCPDEGREVWSSWLGTVMYWLLVPLAVAGVAVLWRSGQRLALAVLLAPFVVVSVVAVSVLGTVRFRVPAEVALLVLAAIGIGVAASRARSSRSTP